MAAPLDHFTIRTSPDERPFKSVLSVRKKPGPERERRSHGHRLLAQIEALEERSLRLAQQRAERGLPDGAGMTLAIESKPPGSFPYDKVEWKRDGTELLSVTHGEDADIVVVFVPDGHLSAFKQRVEAYLTQEAKKSGRPANANLVNAVESFRHAAFDELWTDPVENPPDDATTPHWFQLWLRVLPAGPAETRKTFAELAAQFDITVDPGYVPFPGRIVVAVHASRANLERAVELLDFTAEIRAVLPTAEFFLSDLSRADEVQWVRDLEKRLQPAPPDGPRITLLDTGVAYEHPLLRHHLEAADALAADPAWSSADWHGHGTQMAGLALYGDLTGPLSASEPCEVAHRLESVVLLSNSAPTPPHLYGWVTEQAVDAVETAHPTRRRVFAMMTTNVGTTTGLPSEWSATIDRLAFGGDGQLATPRDEDGQPIEPRRRLFVLAGGNILWDRWHQYPHVNVAETLQNPAQSWNALTVGAYTEQTQIDTAKWPSLKPIAPHGGLAPCSTTSQMWRGAWPFKPDVVAEGGNGAFDGPGAVVVPESLRLLTTSRDFTSALLTETGDTSAAAAEVARLCARISARYPDYWPETVRALVVHGARHTAAMQQQMDAQLSAKNRKIALLRRYGHGAVSAEHTLNSTRFRPTLVIQGVIQPYRRDKSGSRLNVVNLHELPWPAEELRSLDGTEVDLRVTLSYFVEPNPSQRGWQSKFRYQSHGLRFATRGTTETLKAFGERINKIERDASDEDIESMTDPDSAGWALGAKMQAGGSIHSDVWRGNGAQLAQKSHLAVYPVGGWWKDWKEADRLDCSVRYALVVSLDVAESVDIDLYTPIAAKIVVETPVEVLVGT